MKPIPRTVLILLAAGSCCYVSQSWAQGTGGHEGGAEAAQPLEVPQLSERKVVKRSFKINPEERIGVGDLDDEALKKSFSTLSRSPDGTVRTDPPSDDLLKILRDDLQPESGRAPQLRKSERLVVEPDDRVRISPTTKYPFRAIGQLWSVNDAGEWWTCSATLIGERTVITAAHCLYDNEGGGWAKDYEFYPGLNGTTAPYGKYSWAHAHILNGFASNYQGSYGSVMPWDLGVLILDEDAGTRLGWIDYAQYDPAYDFTANIVGYPGDKEQSTMWRASCEVDSGLAEEFNFGYPCDTYPGSSGSAIYDYDPDTKNRRILGVNDAENQSKMMNFGIRLTTGYYAWVRNRVDVDE